MKSLVVVLYVVYSIQCRAKGDQNVLLGKSIYIPTEDLLGSIPNGITFFQNITESCYRKMEHRTTAKEQSFYKNTEDLYKSIATKTNLKAEYESQFSLGFSVDATTKSISGSKRSVSGTSLNLATKAYDLQLSPNCLYESFLQQRVLDDFKELTAQISSPWYKDSWRDYDMFLHTHGSHVVTAVTHGSSIDQYAFGDESSSYTAHQFTIKACSSLAGGAAAILGLSLSACSGVNKDDVQNLTDAKMTSSISVRGGTIETRNRLVYERSNEIIIKFLAEGNEHPSPIQYQLTPIWQILGGHRQAAETSLNRHAQVANMQYFYDGYLNFDCSYVPAGDRGPIIQMFDYAERSTPQHPVFECSLASPGCHDDKDCHYRIAGGCACYGLSCIRHYEVGEISGFEKPSAAPYLEKDWVGQGCKWKNKCRCKNERVKRRIIF